MYLALELIILPIQLSHVQPWKGPLTYIKKATIITTSTITKDYLKRQSGDPIQSNLIDRTFAHLGIAPQNTNWIHFGEVNLTSDSIRKQFMEYLPQLYINGQND
ncbi:hypothetical protein [Companilactobacillus muriivasis]|uniref:hypothetical protein n=1 Tax=Companilactobacillus muriivasis TaxID=3081444 RepID=UPI0030C6A59E